MVHVFYGVFGFAALSGKQMLRADFQLYELTARSNSCEVVMNLHPHLSVLGSTNRPPLRLNSP